MTNGKRTLIIASAVAALGVSALSVGTVFAAGRAPGHGRNMSGLVNAIAEHFHLAPNEVQSVIDQQRQAMSDQMRQQFADRLAASLTQAVKDGKLTQAQADMITAKQAEVKTFEASLKGKSRADRQAAIKTEQDALAQWAKDNNIPPQFASMGRGERGEGMMDERGRDPKGMLDQAVKDGKLTQAQEDQIIAKQAEVKTFMEGLRDKSPADRQTAMTTELTSVKAWAQANNIPEQYVLPPGGRGMHRGGGMGGPGRGWPAHERTSDGS